MRFLPSIRLTGLLRFMALILLATASVAVTHFETAHAGLEMGPDFDIYEGENLFSIKVIKTHPTQQIIAVSGPSMLGYFKLRSALKVLNNIDPRKEIILDVTGYQGGYISNAEAIVEKIKSVCEENRDPKDLTQSCKITSYVGSLQPCGSACIIPYMAGKKRLACTDSVFGFHAQSRGTKISTLEDSISTLLLNGVFKSWIMNHIYMFKTLDVTPLVPSQMIGSNIVTDIDVQCNYLHPVIRSAYERR